MKRPQLRTTPQSVGVWLFLQAAWFVDAQTPLTCVIGGGEKKDGKFDPCLTTQTPMPPYDATSTCPKGVPASQCGPDTCMQETHACLSKHFTEHLGVGSSHDIAVGCYPKILANASTQWWDAWVFGKAFGGAKAMDAASVHGWTVCSANSCNNCSMPTVGKPTGTECMKGGSSTVWYKYRTTGQYGILNYLPYTCNACLEIHTADFSVCFAKPSADKCSASEMTALSLMTSTATTTFPTAPATVSENCLLCFDAAIGAEASACMKAPGATPVDEAKCMNAVIKKHTDKNTCGPTSVPTTASPASASPPSSPPSSSSSLACAVFLWAGAAVVALNTIGL